jgi:hypothetical protein
MYSESVSPTGASVSDSGQDPPLIDHHQHLFSPATTALS